MNLCNEVDPQQEGNARDESLFVKWRVQRSVCDKQWEQIWINLATLAKFCRFCAIVNVSFVFAKILNLLWQYIWSLWANNRIRKWPKMEKWSKHPVTLKIRTGITSSALWSYSANVFKTEINYYRVLCPSYISHILNWGWQETNVWPSRGEKDFDGSFLPTYLSFIKFWPMICDLDR